MLCAGFGGPDGVLHVGRLAFANGAPDLRSVWTRQRQRRSLGQPITSSVSRDGSGALSDAHFRRLAAAPLNLEEPA
jgi:hypothetical protein